jgi:2-keto-4-pentenoate hydratase/2-oxohepta-3-ene-1,7-dioic acid hydratase in catechol pathway
MKLVRYGAPGREKPGIIDADGKIRDLSRIVKDIDGEMLSSGGLAKIRKANLKRLKVVPGKPRLGPCVGHVGNYIAIGLNYSDHAMEAGMPIPKEPVIFNKVTSCIVGANDDTLIPKESNRLDWEVELGIVIGKRARYLDKAKAKDAIAGYFLANDVSERTFQIERSGSQWAKGKGCETFGPIGPWLVTRDEVRNPQNLNMWLDVNGEKRQRGNTRTMIFGVEHLVWYCSQFFVLQPGDIIITGTPPGVGLGMKPPVFLKAGDVVTLGIEGLGEQRQKVVAFKM